MIEGCISLCTHIAAKEFHKVPESYADCFTTLFEKDIIDEKLALRLSKMVGFRNLLIHRYWDIDDNKVYTYMKNDISIVKDYLSLVKKRYLGTIQNDTPEK